MRTIGILGGMGSYATCSLFRRLIDAFPAEKEWERPRILIDNNCTMPSRVRAILYGEQKDKLVSEMSESVNSLVSAGADIILIGCMTAHSFRKLLPHQDKIMNALEVTREAISGKYSAGTEILCLCTEGSVQTGIWTEALPDHKIIYPDDAGMVRLREFIEYVKQNKVTEKIKTEFSAYISETLSRSDGSCVLLGCTELPILYDGARNDVIDPLECAVNYMKREVTK